MKGTRAVWLAVAMVFVVTHVCAEDAADEAGRYVKMLRRDTKDPAELPAKILAAAKSLDGNAKLQVALYEKAYEEGVRTPGGYAAAIQAMEALLEAVPTKAGTWRERLLKVYQLQFARARGPDKREAAERMVDLLIQSGDEHLAAGRAVEAGELYNRAAYLVPAAGSNRKAEIARKLKIARVAKGIQQQVRLYRDRLERDAKDHRARQELVRLHVVELDRPAEAQKLLNADVDETWRTHVPLAVQAPSDLPEAPCLELGNWYWGHAQHATLVGKPRMLARTASYYERFLKLHKKKDAAYLTAKRRLDQLAKARALRQKRTFGLLKTEITAVHRVGHACQVWRILPEYALGTRYRVSIKHAAPGAAGAFYIVAFADTDGNGRPDTRIGTSPLCKAVTAGQWSSWEFGTKHKTVFVGNGWKTAPRIYYHGARHPSGYVGLSKEMYVARAPGKMPTEIVTHRYTNIRVEVIE